MILKYTIWCSYIRKPVKSILKPFISFVKKNILVLTVPQFFGVLLLAMTLTSVYMSKERFNEDNSNSNIVIEKISFCTCMIYLYSFGFFVVMLISSILYQQQYSSKYVEFMHGIFIVGLVLSIPSLQYAIMIVRSPISEFGAALPLFKVFDPELVNYCVTLLLFGFHLLDMQR
jgi:magnesium-transporting ATPase (P-type)